MWYQSHIFHISVLKKVLHQKSRISSTEGIVEEVFAESIAALALYFTIAGGLLLHNLYIKDLQKVLQH